MNGMALGYASRRLRGSKEIVLIAVDERGAALQYASRELRADPEVVMEAIRSTKCQYLSPLYFAAKSILDNEAVVASAMAKHEFAAMLISERLRDNPAIALLAVRKSGKALQAFSNKCRNDREVVHAAVTNCGMALEFASEELRNDKEIVCAAIVNTGRALEFASDALRDDRSLGLWAVKQSVDNFLYLRRRLTNDVEFVLETIDGVENYYLYHLFSLLSETMRENREVMMKAATRNGTVLCHASEEFRDDSELVRKPIATWDPTVAVLQHVSPRLQEDRTIAIAAIDNNIENVFDLCETLKDDVDFMTDLMKKYPVPIDWRTTIIGEKLSDRISKLLDSFGEGVSAGWKEDPNLTMYSVGTNWLHDAIEKRWLLSQIGIFDNQLPLDIQRRIVDFSNIKGDVEVARETRVLAAFLDRIFEEENG